MLKPLRRSTRPELLDDPDADPGELKASLDDLRRINERWGGQRAALAALASPLTRWPAGRAFRFLDVGCGGGDLLVALARRCRAAGVASRLVGVDSHRTVVEIARQRVAPLPEIQLVRCNALELPFADKSFDFVACSLLVHHLAPERAAAFLREAGRLAADGVVVSDLRRGRGEYVLTFLFTRLFARARMTRNDGPLSVLRALTPQEARELARGAGWTDPVVRKCFPLRWLLVNRFPR